MKKILIVAATVNEIQPFIDFLKSELAVHKSPLFMNYAFDVVITGVGMVNTALKVSKALSNTHFDFAINVGIAGLFPKKVQVGKTAPVYVFEKGTVVEVISERYGDLGVEEADGSFTDMFQLGFIATNEPPFTEDRLLNNKPLCPSSLPLTHGLTVQKVHGFPLSIKGILQKYKDVEIETMEGAAFFQVCLTEGVAFSQIRAISNFVESRNRNNWAIQEAIESLNRFLIDLFVEKKV